MSTATATPRKSGSGVSPLNQASWPMVSLGEVGRWFGGGTPSKRNPNFWTAGTIPWVSPKDMKTDRISDAQDHITPEAVQNSATSLVASGSVLVVVRSGILRHTLPVAVTDREVALNQDLKAVTPYEGIDPDFLRLALKSFERQILGTCCKSGTTVQNLSMPAFLRFQIPLPPLDEQRRVVEEIEQQFTRLDAGVAALRSAQTKLKRYRAAVLKAACEGKLVPTEAELARKEGRSFESGEELLQRVLAERRKKWSGRGKYKEPVVPAALDSALPEGWTWATFEQISERVTVGHVGSMKDEYVPDGVPFLRSQNVRENRFDPSGLLFVSPAFHQKLSKSAIQPNDLAVVRSGSVGITCVIPDTLPEANCSDLVLIQRPIGFVPQYGAYYMNSLAKRHVEAGKVGVALTHFNTRSVAAMAVPLPPMSEQIRIVGEVDRRLSLLNELEGLVENNLLRATRFRDSILKQGFGGKAL